MSHEVQKECLFIVMIGIIIFIMIVDYIMPKKSTFIVHSCKNVDNYGRPLKLQRFRSKNHIKIVYVHFF